MYDAYDIYDRNERANERETDAIRNSVWEEHIRTHTDGATDVNATITYLCDTVEELRAENEELRESIRMERADAAKAWELLDQREALLRAAEDREVKLIQKVGQVREQMMRAYAEIAADLACQSPDLLHAVTIDIDRLPASKAA